MAKRIDWDASRRKRNVSTKGYIKSYWDGWKPDFKYPLSTKSPRCSAVISDALFEMLYEGEPRLFKKTDLLGMSADSLFPSLKRELLIAKIQFSCEGMPHKVIELLWAPMANKIRRPIVEKTRIYRKILDRFLELTWLDSVRYEPRYRLFCYIFRPKKHLKKWVLKILGHDLA